MMRLDVQSATLIPTDRDSEPRVVIRYVWDNEAGVMAVDGHLSRAFLIECRDSHWFLDVARDWILGLVCPARPADRK